MNKRRYYTDPKTGISSYAIFSEDERHRYVLDRHFLHGVGNITFIMLNPSTADEMKDDPTVRRCIGLAQREFMARCFIRNIYAYRATDPHDLWAAQKALGSLYVQGPDNRLAITDAIERSHKVITAWGNHAIAPAWLYELMMKRPDSVYHLGLTQQQQPRHPLYVPKDVVLTPWSSSAPPHPSPTSVGAVTSSQGV